MDDALIIATVAKQVENLGTTGSKVGNQISTLFGSLNQGGKQLKEWVKILGPDAFKDSETFMDSLIAHVDQLKQAQADGLLHVKPQVINTWRTILETLQQTKELADHIRGKSNGTLELISEAQMNTYSGQVDRLKASFQELNLALGTELLPTVTRWISITSGTVLPVLAANSGAIIALVKAGMLLGGAYLLMLGITKVSGAFQAFTIEGQSAAIVAQQFRNAELDSVPGMQAATEEMNLQKAALAQLAEQQKVALWQSEQLAIQCKQLGITEEELAVITGERMPGAFARASLAVRGFAGSIVASMAPLLMMYAAMEAVTGGLAAFDDRSNMTNVLNTNLLRKQGGGAEWFHSLNPLNLGSNAENVVSTLTGRDKLAQTQFDNLAKSDPQLEKLYTEFKASHDTAHQDALRQEILLQAGQDFDSKHFKNVPGYGNLDHIPPWLQAEMNRAMGGTPAGMTMPGAGVGAGKKAPQATEQQIAAEETNKDKADAMAEISQWRDKTNAAASYAKTIMEVGKAHGFTSDMVAKLAGHLRDEKTAVQNGENAAKAEIVTLEAQQKHLEALLKTHGATLDAKGNVHGGDKSAAVYAEAKSWRMAQEAIEKAQGAVAGYEAQKAKLSASSSQMYGEATAWQKAAAAYQQNDPATVGHVASLDLGFLGKSISGTPNGNPFSTQSSLEEYLKNLDDQLAHTTTTLGKFSQASNQVSTLKDLGAAIYALYTSTKDPAQLAVYAQMLIGINKAGGEAAKGVTEAQKSTNEFAKNIQDLTTKVATADAEGIGKLLGLSQGDIDAQKTLIDGYNQINDELTQINQWVTQQAGSYANLNATQKQMVQNAINYLNIQQQLIPLLAQQQTIESSIAYQATQATLEKAGQEQIDDAINRLMGTQSNDRVRQQLYDAAKDGTWMSPAQSVLKDYMTNTIGAWWKQTVQQMTGAMFGDPAAQARNLEAQMLKQNRDGLTSIVQNEKTQVVDGLNHFETLFAQDVNRLIKAMGGSTGNGDTPGGNGDGSAPSGWSYMTGGGISIGQDPWNTPGGGGGTNDNARTRGDGKKPLGSEGNPEFISSYGDGPTGFLSGQTSQSNMANAVAQGVDQSATMQKMADNSDALNQQSQDAADNVTNLITQQQGSGTSSNGGGLLQALLGPLGQIPGVSKFLSSSGGQTLNGLIGAAGGGYADGTMIGGAGSTNSDWGAIGGAVGFGAGMAIGGPVGGQIGGMIGGLFGGLFGHSVNPLDEPDVYDTQNYGKFVANVNGAPGTFNGVTIAPDPQYDLSDGGTPLDQAMATWAQRNPNNPIAKQLIALGPKLDIASEYQGIFTLGSGKTISVTAYEQLVQQYQSAAGGQQNAPLVSVNAYGGGGASGAYNTPGMDSSTFLAEEAAWASGMSGSSGYGEYNAPPQVGGGGAGGGGGSSPNFAGGATGLVSGSLLPSATATPGYGGAGPNTYASPVTSTSLSLVFTTPLYLDGRIITQVVNAYNAQMRSNAGYVGHSADQ